MIFGSLFSGIGGMDLGLERAGMDCAWQVEIDEFCRKVLTKHWPEVPKYNDVRECGKHNLKPVDLIAGGFPCQDVSSAGAKIGIDGDRSGLWREFARVISELRPRFVLVENVSGLLERGMGRVIGDLAAIRYDAEWKTLPACLWGAPHCRERVWIIAYPQSNGLQRRVFQAEAQRFLFKIQASQHWSSGVFADWKKLLAEPDVHNMADGFPRRVVELTALGNAVVPQVAQWIGERIMKS